MGLNAKLLFTKSMIRFGLVPPKTIISDNNVHLCTYEKDSERYENGWYIFSDTKPAMGICGCWGVRRFKIWPNKKVVSMTEEERIIYFNRLYEMKIIIKHTKKNIENNKTNANNKFNESKDIITLTTLNKKAIREEKYNKDIEHLVEYIKKKRESLGCRSISCVACKKNNAARI